MKRRRTTHGEANMKHNKGKPLAKPPADERYEAPNLRVVEPVDESPRDNQPWADLVNRSGAVAMQVRIMWVTPEIAKRWLEKNHPDNRALAWSRIAAYSGDIKNGAWKLTHQAVAFGKDGFLIDGQHRLHAIAQADEGVELLVIKHGAGTYHDPIDRGGARTIAAIMGTGSREAAAYNIMRHLELGFKQPGAMTLADAEAVFERHQGSFDRLKPVRNRNKLVGPVLAACAWAVPTAPEKVIDFAGKVANGEMIGRGDAVFAFRNWQERNKRGDGWATAMACFNCLRYHVHNMPMTSVYTGESGYRAFTAKRRQLKLPYTPVADVVPGAHWTPTRGEDRNEAPAPSGSGGDPDLD